MGIRGNFKSWLSTNYPVCFKEVTYYELKNKKIAVDISPLMFNYKSWATDWISTLTNYLINFKKYNITLYIIFEGKSCDDKTDEKIKRKNNKDKLNLKKIEIQNNLEKLNSSKKISKEFLNYYLDLNSKRNKNSYYSIEYNLVNDKELDQDEINIINNICNIEIEKIDKQLSPITESDLQKLKKNFDDKNIFYFQANGEAEHLCVELCKRKIVEIVYSDDSDLIPLACPIILTKIPKSDNFCLLEIDNLLNNMDKSMEYLRDLAIFCGTDYNHGIPKIGIITAIKILNKYKSIDCFLNSKDEVEKYNIKNDDLKKFNYEKVREIFALKDLIFDFSIFTNF